MGMMLGRRSLRKLTSSDHISSHSIGLTVADVKEVVGVPELEDGSVDVDSGSVEIYQDKWQIGPGTFYLVFNESVTFQSNTQVGLLLPHTNIIRCGGIMPPRLLEPSGPREVRATLYAPSRIKIDSKTPVASLMVFKDA